MRRNVKKYEKKDNHTKGRDANKKDNHTKGDDTNKKRKHEGSAKDEANAKVPIRSLRQKPKWPNSFNHMWGLDCNINRLIVDLYLAGSLQHWQGRTCTCTSRYTQLCVGTFPVLSKKLFSMFD